MVKIMFMVCFVYCLRNKARASRKEVWGDACISRSRHHAAIEGELGTTAKQTQHYRYLWEGRGCEIQPNGGVDFGKAVHLRVLSNSTVPLPFDGRGCKIQLNGGVHFSWGINPTGQLTWRSEGWEWCPTQRSRSLKFAIGGLISRDVQLQPNGAVGLGKKGLLTLRKKTIFSVFCQN